ncbi:hypothetical protein BCV69DRAFT_21653 [Microstroma glucosiphilum]|uniref:Metallo-beta-lactamase domain-containing protein n=1 Tax=Pseudomicrostroma glucosiphilum TaxID=1684307 RepID=A0A316UGU9_9BASI|nr:hypothetical protein BCV69DRAFT_21653 [Pseudomicrostroma glucosiphilum]PWN24158.1 hypothetical protein BCV69DRAFT_21653 [Pseudomicrostroma glucosiphilum]
MTKAILRRLNGDTTWLVQLPFLDVQSATRAKTYNLLIDPWLSDSEQIDFHSSFSSQSRNIASAYPTLSSLSQALAHEALEKAGQERVEYATEEERTKAHGGGGSGRIDGILISHPFTDHAHPQSLLEMPDRTEGDDPLHLFCTQQSRKAVLSLFQKAGVEKDRYRIFLLPVVGEGEDFFAKAQTALPAGIRIVRLPAKEGLFSAWGDLHSGLAILWQSDGPDSTFSSIVYSPHGTLQTSLPSWLSKAHHRLLVTSFDEQTLPLLRLLTGPVALGFETAVLCCYSSEYTPKSKTEHYSPTIVVRTHDERKTAKGLVARVISRKEMQADEAQKMLQQLFGELAGRVVDLEVGETLEV